MASYTLHIQYVDRPAETRTFTQAKITFGRDVGDIVLHDSQVSGRHGEITFDGNTLRYTDVGSTNGSFLMQGQRVANIELTPGIALRLGNSLVTVQAIDAPNVAGKGRTVIAGPGMAPGFPAPMRPAPGPGPVVAAGAPIPRPPAPAPVAPGAPPGGFAFAPTAQMQSPAMPGTPPSQQPRPGFSAAPPQPGFAPAPPQPVAPAPFQPMPAPVFHPGGPGPGSFQPAPAPVRPMAPAPVAAVPEVEVEAGDDAEYAATPIPSAPEPIAALAAVEPAGPSAEAPKDLVTGLKQGAAGGWAVVQPVAVMAFLMAAAVFVPINTLTALMLMILPLSLLGIVSLLMSIATLVGVVVLMPSIYRYVLGAYLGVPIEPKAAVQETVAKINDRAVNCFVPMIPLGIFAGPIYYVENKKLGEVVSRNFQLWGKDWVTAIVTVIAVSVGFSIARYVLAMVLGFLPLGLLLAMIVAGLVSAAMTTYFVGISIWFYFNYRRRFEGGDPESEGRAALAGISSLPQA
jgi:hypothetical protein